MFEAIRRLARCRRLGRVSLDARLACGNGLNETCLREFHVERNRGENRRFSFHVEPDKAPWHRPAGCDPRALNVDFSFHVELDHTVFA